MSLSLERWVGKVAVVTGASSGIGAEICQQLVKNGITVAGLARREERLDDLKKKLSNEKGKLLPVKCDMTKEDDILAAFKIVKDQLGPVSILINNAGLMKNTSLLNGDTDSWKTTFDTNVIGLCIATREAVKQMTENNIDGHVIHVNSVLGHKVLHTNRHNVYPASKFAVTALTESLRHEINIAKLKVKITSVSPGLVHTEFVETYDPKIVDKVSKLPGLKAEDVAGAIVYALSTPQHVNVDEITLQAVGEI